MDAFFLSVELRERPELSGMPTAVAGEGLRAVVLSASYEARRFGVRSAMPVGHARRLCPQLRLLAPHREKYLAVSRQVMQVLGEVTPVLEQLSIDEAFLDVSGARRRLGPPEAIAGRIRERVRAETGLACSVGGAPVKFAAKMASQAAKPDGMLVVPGERLMEFLHPLPVGRLWGVGPVLADRLTRRGVETIGDLAACDPAWLRARFGEHGARLTELAAGRDPRPVGPREPARSVGQDKTFDHDPEDPAEIDGHVLRLAHAVASRLRAAGTMASAVTVRVKDQQGAVRSRTARLTEPTNLAAVLYEPARRAVRALLSERRHPVRLLGLRAERLGSVGHGQAQPALFAAGPDADGGSDVDPRRWGRAEQALDDVRRRFPSAALGPATLLDPSVADEGERS